MAKSSLRRTSDKLLNPTERKAMARIVKMHEPMMREMEKWKEQRERLEEGLLDQIERIGQFLEPYQNPARLQATLAGLMGQPRAKSPIKRSSSTKRSSKTKRSTAKRSKSRSR